MEVSEKINDVSSSTQDSFTESEKKARVLAYIPELADHQLI